MSENIKLHRLERDSLCTLLLSKGPDAPTLCQGWTTTDLAVHLIVRENNLLAAPGIRFGGPFKKLLMNATERAKNSSFEDLVAALRSGPPAWLRPIDKTVNLMEFFVHHEDVRRGSGEIGPRNDSYIPVLNDSLWRVLQRMGWLLARPLGRTGMILRRTDIDRNTERIIRKGSPIATLSGSPGELLLYLMGRGQAAQVKIDGLPQAVDALSRASFEV